MREIDEIPSYIFQAYGYHALTRLHTSRTDIADRKRQKKSGFLLFYVWQCTDIYKAVAVWVNTCNHVFLCQTKESTERYTDLAQYT